MSKMLQGVQLLKPISTPPNQTWMLCSGVRVKTEGNSNTNKINLRSISLVRNDLLSQSQLQCRIFSGSLVSSLETDWEFRMVTMTVTEDTMKLSSWDSKVLLKEKCSSRAQLAKALFISLVVKVDLWPRGSRTDDSCKLPNLHRHLAHVFPHKCNSKNSQ